VVRQRAPGRCGSCSTDDRPESLAVPVLRSDGDTSSLDGATGGAALGAGARAPPNVGLAPSGIGDAGTGR